MSEMNHRAHHLYAAIKFICEYYYHEECRASRETLCRMLGDSPNSLRLITEALKQLKDVDLINIIERNGSPHIITLNEHHERAYALLIEQDFKAALNEARDDNGAPKQKVAQVRKRDADMIAAIERDFIGDDFKFDKQ